MSIRIRKPNGELTRLVYTDETDALRALKRRKEIGAAVVTCQGDVPKVWLHHYENDGVHSLSVATGKVNVAPHKA